MNLNFNKLNINKTDVIFLAKSNILNSYSMSLDIKY